MTKHTHTHTHTHARARARAHTHAQTHRFTSHAGVILCCEMTDSVMTRSLQLRPLRWHFPIRTNRTAICHSLSSPACCVELLTPRRSPNPKCWDHHKAMHFPYGVSTKKSLCLCVCVCMCVSVCVCVCVWKCSL